MGYHRIDKPWGSPVEEKLAWDANMQLHLPLLHASFMACPCTCRLFSFAAFSDPCMLPEQLVGVVTARMVYAGECEKLVGLNFRSFGRAVLLYSCAVICLCLCLGVICLSSSTWTCRSSIGRPSLQASPRYFTTSSLTKH